MATKGTAVENQFESIVRLRRDLVRTGIEALDRAAVAADGAFVIEIRQAMIGQLFGVDRAGRQG